MLHTRRRPMWSLAICRLRIRTAAREGLLDLWSSGSAVRAECPLEGATRLERPAAHTELAEVVTHQAMKPIGPRRHHLPTCTAEGPNNEADHTNRISRCILPRCTGEGR